MLHEKRLSDHFYINIKMLKATGLWFDLRHFGSNKIIVVYSLLVNVLFIFSPQICHVIYMYKARNNVKDFSNEFYVSLSSIVVFLKDVSMVKNFDKLKKLMRTVDSDVMLPKSFHQVNQFEKVMGIWKKIYWCNTFICICFCVLQLISPLIDTYINGTRLLPLVDCYPFDIYTSPSYEIMYLYQSCVLFWLVIHNYNCDTFITGLISFASAQCDMLCDTLRRLTVKEGGDTLEMKRLERRLVRCIKHHQKITRFLKEVENCFSLNLFEQYCCSLITFCTTMFNLSLAEPFSEEFFTIIFYQASIFMEMFLFSWTGTILTAKQSEVIPSAAFESNWVEASKTFKHNLLIFIKRTQRPFFIRVILFSLSLEVFVQLVKTSFSYYTVLTTLNDK